MKGHVFCFKIHLNLKLQESRVEGVNGHISTDEMEKLHVELHLKLLSEKKKTFYADVDV